MPAKRFPISDEAIAAAARFIRVARRSYSRAGEPAHPSLRQVVAHLVGRGLVNPKRPPPPVTLGRALKRAGLVLPPHWRSRLKKKVEVNIFRDDCSIGGPQEKPVVARKSLCSSVDDGGTTRSPRCRAAELARRPTRAHPWRPRPDLAEGGAP
jgi:hypothetical protein